MQTCDIVGRRVLTTPISYFMKSPMYYLPPHLFQILSNLGGGLPPTATPTALSVVLFLWPNGWLCHIWCATLSNGTMDSHMSNIGTSVPEGPWCKFYATRHRVYWGLTHMIFCWYSDLISHTQTHTHTESTLRGQ